jgi:uncharacterized membrane protein YjdF
MMLLWGYKTEAMFDLWSIEHFINGIALAGVAVWITRILLRKKECSPETQKIVSFIVLLTLALMWECVEHYLESGVLTGAIGDRVTHWFQGVEHWSNRLIGDTLTVMLGWCVYNWKKNLAIPAKIFSVIWMIVHIFVFPDSMYLHRLLFGGPITP